MNPLTPIESDEQISRVLRAWAVDTPLPPRFQERVWRRISQAETKPASGWGGVMQWLAETFVRPRVACTYMALLVGCGVAAGVWTAQVERNRLDITLGERYVQSLDPYQFAAEPSR